MLWLIADHPKKKNLLSATWSAQYVLVVNIFLIFSISRNSCLQHISYAPWEKQKSCFRIWLVGFVRRDHLLFFLISSEYAHKVNLMLFFFKKMWWPHKIFELVIFKFYQVLNFWAFVAVNFLTGEDFSPECIIFSQSWRSFCYFYQGWC